MKIKPLETNVFPSRLICLSFLHKIFTFSLPYGTTVNHLFVTVNEIPNLGPYILWTFYAMKTKRCTSIMINMNSAPDDNNNVSKFWATFPSALPALVKKNIFVTQAYNAIIIKIKLNINSGGSRRGHSRRTLHLNFY